MSMLFYFITFAVAGAIDDDALSLLQSRATLALKEDVQVSPIRSRQDNKCLDYNYNNHNVYMHPCHGGSNQNWYIVNEQLKTKYNNLCLTMNDDSNVYMDNCQDGAANQQWYFADEALRTRASEDKCLDYHMGNSNIYMHPCHGNRNQQFYFKKPANPAFASRVKSRFGDKCMDYNFNNGNIYFHTCHDGTNQKFYLDGTDMKSVYDDKCMDYNYNNQNVYMHNCHNGKNQQWFFAGGHLKTNYNNKCLDLHMENLNVYMHPCHSGDNQQFYMEGVMDGLQHDEIPDEVGAEVEDNRECKDWCYSEKHKNKAWEGKKCAWKSCAKCDECGN